MLKFKFALDTIFSQLSSYPQVHVTFCSITGKLLETLLVAFFGLLISLFFFRCIDCVHKSIGLPSAHINCSKSTGSLTLQLNT